MKEEWLLRGAVVPVDVETTAALLVEIHRLIDVVGGLILKQGPDYEREVVDCHATGVCVQSSLRAEQPAQQDCGCAECGKKEKDGWYLYCVECMNKTSLAQPAQEPVAVYVYCPECGAKGVTRERRPNGNDKCVKGHTYPSNTAAPPQRTWVGLTEDEIQKVSKQARSKDHAVTLTNKLLKDKNT